MKKTITLLCAFVLAISLNSCSSSDDSSGESSGDKIVGNWKYIGDMYMGTFEAYDSESCDDEFYKFSGNNTGKYTDKYCDDVDDIVLFNWEKTSDPVFNYILTNEDGSEFYPIIVVFSSDFKQITLYETEDDMLMEEGGEVFQKQ